MPSDGVLPAPVHKAKGGAGNGRERAKTWPVWPVYAGGRRGYSSWVAYRLRPLRFGALTKRKRNLRGDSVRGFYYLIQRAGVFFWGGFLSPFFPP